MCLQFCALGEKSRGYLGGGKAHTIRSALSWLYNLYFLPSREQPPVPLPRPKPQLQMNKHDIKADIGQAPRIWAHILPNFEIKRLSSLKCFQERMAFVAGNNPHILSHILGDRHLKVPLLSAPKVLCWSLFLVWFGFKKGPMDYTIPQRRGDRLSTAVTHTGQRRVSVNIGSPTHMHISVINWQILYREANKIKL